MAHFTWTAPDPLVYREDVVTRSIYITELQDAVNVRRAEIEQPAITFTDQSVGKIFKLSAIEELKTATDQLAIDFGYTGGVESEDLLGRDFVDHPTDGKGFPLAGFPIINDLRLVLNLLEQQVELLTFRTIIASWYNNGLSGVFPLAAYTDHNNTPWNNIPDFIMTGAGSSCEEGYPTCDNTQAGFYRALPYKMTDRTLIDFYGTSGTLREKPLTSDILPYGYNIGSVWSDVLKSTSAFDLDEEHFYSVSDGGGNVYKAPRDASESRVFLGSFGWGPAFSTGDRHSLFVLDNYVVYLAHTGAQGWPVIDRMGVMDKSTGNIITDIELPFLNISGGTANPHHTTWNYGMDGFYARNNKIYAVYGEFFSDGLALPEAASYWEASAIVELDIFGNGSAFSHLDTNTLTPPAGAAIEYRHAIGGSIFYGNSQGFSYNKENGGSYLTQEGVAHTPSEIVRVFEGTPLPTQDYKGDVLPRPGTTPPTWGIILWSDAYLEHNTTTPDITGIAFTLIERLDNGGPGVHDTLHITWNRTKGAFRYKIMFKTPEMANWGGPIGTFESNEFGSGDVFDETINTYVDDWEDAYYRIDMETGQGIIEGIMSPLMEKTEPYGPPEDAPENAVATSTIIGQVDVTWDDPSPLTGGPITSYEYQWRYLTPIYGPFSGWTDIGLVNNVSISGLDSGETVQVWIRGKNSSGIGPTVYPTAVVA